METDESYSQFIEILVEKSNIGDHPDPSVFQQGSSLVILREAVGGVLNL